MDYRPGLHMSPTKSKEGPYVTPRPHFPASLGGIKKLMPASQLQWDPSRLGPHLTWTSPRLPIHNFAGYDRASGGKLFNTTFFGRGTSSSQQLQQQKPSRPGQQLTTTGIQDPFLIPIPRVHSAMSRLPSLPYSSNQWYYSSTVDKFNTPLVSPSLVISNDSLPFTKL